MDASLRLRSPVMSGTHRRERTGFRVWPRPILLGLVVAGLTASAAGMTVAVNEGAPRLSVEGVATATGAPSGWTDRPSAVDARSGSADAVATERRADPRLRENTSFSEMPASRGRKFSLLASSDRAARQDASASVILPESGSGDFLTRAGRSNTTGVGVLTTYTVEVEREVPIAPFDAASVVDRVLTDRRGWTASGEHSLARVDSDSDIRVLLATPKTVDTLCAPLDTGGRLSCRNGQLVVLNAWRWFNGAPAYGDNLRDYRRYLISHEFGHALGNPHVECPGAERLAPVMMQQTKGLGDCVANPWPIP